MHRLGLFSAAAALGLAASPAVAQSGTVVVNDIVDGSLGFTTPDTLLTLTPQLDGFAAPFGGGTSSGGCCFGVINDQLNDTDGDPATTSDQEAVLLAFDPTVGLTSLSFIFTRATTEILDDVVVGPLEDGIRISGFLSDPGAVYFDGSGDPLLPPSATFNNLSEVESVSYDALTGTLNIDHAWRGGAITTFQFENVAASLGQTLTVTVADQDEANPQLNFREIQYGATALALPILFADANGDGVVDLLDFDILAQNFGNPTTNGAADGDFNGDGVVDLLDFDALAQEFGSSLPAAVPEPASLGLMGLAGLAATRRRRT
ncbi:MAG: dockerin type I domain-containing protein [Planctomycetota bacterium]